MLLPEQVVFSTYIITNLKDNGAIERFFCSGAIDANCLELE